MLKKLAKLKYFPNNYKIIDKGDYVICAGPNNASPSLPLPASK